MIYAYFVFWCQAQEEMAWKIAKMIVNDVMQQGHHGSPEVKSTKVHNIILRIADLKIKILSFIYMLFQTQTYFHLWKTKVIPKNVYAPVINQIIIIFFYQKLKFSFTQKPKPKIITKIN